MGEILVRYAWVVLMLLISRTALCQSETPLNAIFPSYTEAFHDNKTFPAVCINDAWQDADGRFWLKTCSPVASDRLYLFQFDGYDFRLISDVFDTLNPHIEIQKRLKDDVYVGYGADNGTSILAVVDLLQKQITYYQWPQGYKTVGPECDDSGAIAMLVLDPESWVIRTIQNGALTSRHLPVPPASAIPGEESLWGFVFFNDREIWWFNRRNVTPYRMNMLSGRLDTFSLAKTLRSKTSMTCARIRLVGGEVFMVFRDNTGERITRLNRASGEFEELSWPGGLCRYIDVFEDAEGNVLYSVLYPDGSQQARLCTSDGRWLDYSAFVSDLHEARVRQVVGRDFTNELLICHDGGIVLDKIGITGAIRHILDAESIRAMTQLSDEDVLITTQAREAFTLNLISGDLSVFGSDCDVFTRRFLREHGETRWIANKKGLYRTDRRFQNCTPVVTEFGNIALLARVDSTSLAFVSNDGVVGVYHTDTREVNTVADGKDLLHITGRPHDAWCDPNKILWVASSTGLWKIQLQTQEVDILGSEPPFIDSRFLCIDPDEQGRLWLGTVVGGIHIYNPADGSVKILDSDNGLANNTVVSIEHDREGVRWAGTYSGVSMISPEGRVISNLYIYDGLADTENNRYASFVAPNGNILIGSVKGLNIIDPEHVKASLKREENVQLYLTSASYTSQDGISHQLKWFDDLDHLGELILPATKRSLKVSFALSDYFNAGNNQYAYLLKGRDAGWRQIGNLHSLELEDLPAGDYTLLIKGTNSEGILAGNQLEIPFTARAFFYEHWWFYVLCFVLVATLVILWISRLRTEVTRATALIRQDKEIIEHQAEQLKELDRAKSHFFTNISHEFRTPLTIISGMASQIQEHPQAWAAKGAEMIKQSSGNLLTLVNQILDLRKLESSEMQLNLIQGDLLPYLQYLVNSFGHYAKTEGKVLEFVSEETTVQMDYDPDKMLQIVSNLVSNAIRHTRDGDRIVVSASRERDSAGERFIMSVSDNGPGIPEEKLPYLFDRFFQAGEPSDRSGGTGIGLALTKELVTLMGGIIDVQSTLGTGTTFTIKLPIRHEAIRQEMEMPLQVPGPLESEGQELPEEDEMVQTEMPGVLVVEDNPEVRQVLVACLKPHYSISIAEDGRQGIDMAFEIVPDLIISDVMMPGKNGYELCAILKQDHRTDHVPIVLLTARSDMESRVTGLEYGADDYLTKPFEPKELLARLDNLLKLRQKLQERYTSDPTAQQTEHAQGRPTQQDMFISKLQDAVSTHIDDENFGVTQLCRIMTLGRTQLHQKIKALTGMSTTGYIRHIRLEKGRELLRTTEMNVSEVAYAVGFSDARYFSRMFHEKFGEPPSRTRK